VRVATRLGLMAFGAAAVFLIIGATSFISVSSLIKANQWVSHSRQVLQELNMLMYNLSDTIASQRSYMITGQEVFLDAYRALVASTNESISKVEELVNDNPVQENRARNISTLIKERLASLEITTKLYQEKGVDAAFDRVKHGKSLYYRNVIHKAIDEMKQFEINLLQERTEQMQRSADSSQFTVISGACLGLILVSLFSYLFAKYILNSIGQLVRAADNIRYGRFDLSVTPAANDDEFAELVEAFNNVGQQLMIVSKKLSDQQTEIEAMSDKAVNSQDQLEHLNEALSKASSLSYDHESLLQEREEQATEIQEIFSSLDDLGVQLENVSRHNLELLHRIGRSRERAEESVTSIIGTLNILSKAYELKTDDLLNLKLELTKFQDSVKSFENLISNLDMLSISTELEKARTKSTDPTAAVFLEKLKSVLEEAKKDKTEFYKTVSAIRAEIEDVLKSFYECSNTISTKRSSASQVQTELGKLAELHYELSDNGIEVPLKIFTRLVKSKRMLPGKIEKNIGNSKEYAKQLHNLLRERSTI